jgi:hypothetical protein
MADVDEARKAIAKAWEKAMIAHVVPGGSYTYAAMSACKAAEIALHGDGRLNPDWISEYLAYPETPCQERERHA